MSIIGPGDELLVALEIADVGRKQDLPGMVPEIASVVGQQIDTADPLAAGINVGIVDDRNDGGRVEHLPGHVEELRGGGNSRVHGRRPGLSVTRAALLGSLSAVARNVIGVTMRAV
ncbi:hypothetical protein [Hankyongella ginsenosidimutans]|uniref:hypothetical protein n=1 Tax=Hankyongella ginsenosidimutans TaxID=1763828 RepID=UPI001FEBDF91|nr:hypothetical protein [Hankyongella ginsenosidimutans]